MPSPFPGMDPYLENTDFWPGFHNGFMHYAQEDLQPRLPPGYVATLEMRVYFEPDPESQFRRLQRVPDLEVVRTVPRGSFPEQQRAPATGTVLEINPVQVEEAYLMIRELPGGRVVTSIEMLSPSNKASGAARDEYLSKQWNLYGAGANLVELDLLRGGMNTVLASSARLATLPPFHYLAGVYRASEPLKYEVFPWTVRDPMPVIPLPLDPGVPELAFDLGAVFTRTFDTGAFRRLLRYREEPRPPLEGGDTGWAEDVLRQAGPKGDELA